jgi:DNA mismatch endonuclease, patch repair protein
MPDVVSPAVRSRMMGAINSKNTKPEMIIRRGLHKRGFRYLLHAKQLPGKPDLYFPKYRAAIFVHGCFWHGHECEKFRWPKTRVEWWRDKIEGNRRRDAIILDRLQSAGINTYMVWACELDSRKAERAISQAASWLLAKRIR